MKKTPYPGWKPTTTGGSQRRRPGKESAMILFGIPRHVQRFFAPVRPRLSRPIRNALPAMVLALLLVPSRRCLKTLGGAVLGTRAAACTISRRLRSALWRTRDWYVALYDDVRRRVHQWEQRQQRLS